MMQDPKNYEEAIKSNHRKQRLTAMIEALDALQSYDVWTVVLPPKGAHVLHINWVNTTKNMQTDTLRITRLVCRDEGAFGVNYTLTIAAVMELETVKLIFIFSS